MNKTSNSPDLGAFKKKLPNNYMNTPPPSPCSAMNKTPKAFTPKPQSGRKSSVQKNSSFVSDSPIPDIARYHVSRPLTPSTSSEKSEGKFSFHVDNSIVEENCKKPSHARLGLNISQLNSSFYDLKTLTNPKSTNPSTAYIVSKCNRPESFIATKTYNVPNKSSNNDYFACFDSAQKKGLVCTPDLDPLSKPIKKAEALKEKRRVLAQKLSFATKGASFSPISRVVKKAGGFESISSTPTSVSSLPEDDFKNVIQSGCVNDVISKDIERTSQEGNLSVKDLLMNGYFLHSGRCVDLEVLKNESVSQILVEDANANVDELSSHFQLNVILLLSYIPCTSYFNVQLERTCSMVGHVVKGLSIENDMKNVKVIAEKLNEEFASLDMKVKNGDPKLVYSMNTSNFPTSTYIEKEEDLKTSIEKLGAVHGCIITCILRMKLNGISQKELSKLPKCFRNSDQYFLAKLICNDNLNRQFLSQGVWQLLSLELFDNDVSEDVVELSDEINSTFECEEAENLEPAHQLISEYNNVYLDNITDETEQENIEKMEQITEESTFSNELERDQSTCDSINNETQLISSFENEIDLSDISNMSNAIVEKAPESVDEIENQFGNEVNNESLDVEDKQTCNTDEILSSGLVDCSVQKFDNVQPEETRLSMNMQENESLEKLGDTNAGTNLADQVSSNYHSSSHIDTLQDIVNTQLDGSIDEQPTIVTNETEEEPEVVIQQTGEMFDFHIVNVSKKQEPTPVLKEVPEQPEDTVTTQLDETNSPSTQASNKEAVSVIEEPPASNNEEGQKCKEMLEEARDSFTHKSKKSNRKKKK